MLLSSTAERQPILKELDEINTIDSSGSTTKAAEAIAVRLKEAGFPDTDLHAHGRDAREFLCRLVTTLGSPETTPVTHRLGSSVIPGESYTQASRPPEARCPSVP